MTCRGLTTLPHHDTLAEVHFFLRTMANAGALTVHLVGLFPVEPAYAVTEGPQHSGYDRL